MPKPEKQLPRELRDAGYEIVERDKWGFRSVGDPGGAVSLATAPADGSLVELTRIVLDGQRGHPKPSSG
jgi:hypothetical protein